jgi:hypothetical protein
MAIDAGRRTAWIGGGSVTILAAGFLAAWSLVLVRLGPADARAYLVIRGLVALAAALLPISASRWVQAYPALVPGFAKRVAVMIELAIAAATTIALVATASWWSRRAGIAAPAPWLIAAASLHHAASRLNRAIVKLGVAPEGTLYAALAMLGQLATSPLAALLHGSLAFVIGGAGVASVALAGLALRVPPRATGEVSPARALIDLPAWLNDLSQALPRNVIALVVAGVMLVPYESAALLSWLLFTPFMLAALPASGGAAPKLARGVVLAAIYWALVTYAGAPLYQTVFPGWFGGAPLMRCCAWTAVALVPLSYNWPRKGEPDWRTVVMSLAGIAALIVLVPARGVRGVINANVIRLTVAATLGIADPTRREEQLLG